MAKIIEVVNGVAQGGFDRGKFDGTFVEVNDRLKEGKIAEALQFGVEAISINGTGENLFHVVVPLGAKGDQKGYPMETAEQIVALIHRIQDFVDDAPKIK
jgi:hypothetical protein